MLAAGIQIYSFSFLAAHVVSAAIFGSIVGILTDKFSERKLSYLIGVLSLLLAVILFLGWEYRNSGHRPRIIRTFSRLGLDRGPSNTD